MPFVGRRGVTAASNFGQRNSGVGPLVGTGGTITTVNIGGINYKIHTFLAVGSASITFTGKGSVTAMLVGGGGGGGMLGGGGGGGGIIYASAQMLPGTYGLYVGNGGAGAIGWADGYPGESTTAFGLTALGGGAGHCYTGNVPSRNQGVANTGGYSYSTRTGATVGSMTLPAGWTGTAYGGYNGGANDAGCCSCRGGGGGGAGGNGYGYASRDGGPGIALSIDGIGYYWSGGGGNDGYCSNAGGNGGIGGGGGGSGQSGGSSGGGSARNAGAAGPSGDPTWGGAGGTNTGGGGGSGTNGGGSTSAGGGKGGSGIIMIKYAV